jgi:hypothetical protein
MTGTLFTAERLPVLQNRTFATAAEALASPTGDVVLQQDERTGIVSNRAFDASLLSYDGDYQNEQAGSAVFRRHLDEVTAILGRHFKGHGLLEIGCGKGYFLDQLAQRGYDIRGMDPAYEGDNPRIARAPFTAGCGAPRADGIVLRHVLEHMAAPVDFLADITDANGGRGGIYIEVPSLEWIMAHRAWFDVFYEHVNYFTLADFGRMFGRIHEQGSVFGGQYLYVVADLSTLRRPRGGFERIVFPADFMAGVERAARLARAHAGRSAIWGGSSKGVIFSTYLQRRSVAIDFAIDINPAKQRRFLPCTGLEVCSPEDAARRLEPADNVFVMNSNYLDEIRSQSGNAYTYITVDHG